MNNRIGLIHIYRDQKLGDYRKVIFIDRILPVDKGDQVSADRFSRSAAIVLRCSSPWGASRASDRSSEKKNVPIGCLLVETLLYCLQFLSRFIFFVRLFLFLSSFYSLDKKSRRGTL